MLNFLDGVNSSNGVVVVITVNELAVVPEVLLRAGRIDLRVEMPLARHEQAAEYARLVYADLPAFDDKTAAAIARAACARGPVALSALQNVLFHHITDPAAAIRALAAAPLPGDQGRKAERERMVCGSFLQ
jgi:SpoVK/Ycf46/Vps4 family AAA+-type ATPase